MKLPTSAICVQSFDDSLSPAIHTTYRISLRSSSLREPRYPLLRVVLGFFLWPTLSRKCRIQMSSMLHTIEWLIVRKSVGGTHTNTHPHTYISVCVCARLCFVPTGFIRMGWYGSGVNDPSAGSPTETLLRLLLPLNDKVQATSRR